VYLVDKEQDRNGIFQIHAQGIDADGDPSWTRSR
jgi:hypothetical protein